MRKAINDNPMVQIGVIGLLVVVVGFFLLTQMGRSSSSSSTTSSSPTSSSSASVVPDSSAASTDSSAAAPTPSDATSTTPVGPADGAVAPATTPGKFVAGPGLPSRVVQAYNADKAVVLLVVRHGGIDDDAVKASVEGMGGLPDVAVFVTNAGHVSRYSRIASGVSLDRVPALIVLRPQKLSHGTPTAAVSYGFRGPDSVAQAIADALYKGPTDLPYYPK